MSGRGRLICQVHIPVLTLNSYLTYIACSGKKNPQSTHYQKTTVRRKYLPDFLCAPIPRDLNIFVTTTVTLLHTPSPVETRPTIFLLHLFQNHLMSIHTTSGSNAYFSLGCFVFTECSLAPSVKTAMSGSI